MTADNVSRARRSAPGLEDLCPSRRNVLRTLAAIGGVSLVPGLAACSNDDSDSGSGGSGASPSVAASTGTGGATLVAVADVKLGTAVVVEAPNGRVLVAQPTEGEFVAFSAVCTHEQANVRGGDSTVVSCPAHGSEFDLADGGKVVDGPATEPLRSLTVTRNGDQLALG